MRKTNTLVYIVQIGDAAMSGSGSEVRTVSNREDWKKVVSATDYQISFPNWNSQATAHPQPGKRLEVYFFWREQNRVSGLQDQGKFNAGVYHTENAIK